MNGCLSALLVAFSTTACLSPAPDREAPKRVTAASGNQPVLQVPWTGSTIHCDGNFDDAAWPRAISTGPLLRSRDGGMAQPYSSVHAVWHAPYLYLALYAADDHVQVAHSQHGVTDSFLVQLQGTDVNAPVAAFRMHANGSVAPVGIASHVTTPALQRTMMVAAQVDGTVNHDLDKDEEWRVEAAIPLAPLGVDMPSDAEGNPRLHASFRRCDTGRDGQEHCGAWGEDAKGHPIGMLELAPAAPNVD